MAYCPTTLSRMERKGRLDARIILLHETLALEEVEQLLNMMELSLDWDEGVRFAPLFSNRAALRLQPRIFRSFQFSGRVKSVIF